MFAEQFNFCLVKRAICRSAALGISVATYHAITPGLSLALIGNASAQKFAGRRPGPEAFSIKASDNPESDPLPSVLLVRFFPKSGICEGRTRGLLNTCRLWLRRPMRQCVGAVNHPLWKHGSIPWRLAACNGPVIYPTSSLFAHILVGHAVSCVAESILQRDETIASLSQHIQ